LKKELADYKQHHQREVKSLTTELTRLKAALDFETEEVARLKATSATFL
jgi:cell shape-determining protein MreC